MDKFYRSTTPTHIFDFTKSGIEPSELQDFQIVFKQRGGIVLEKHKTDVLIDGKKVYYKLTETESKKFLGGELVKVQLMAIVNATTILASDIYELRVEEVIKEAQHGGST